MKTKKFLKYLFGFIIFTSLISCEKDEEFLKEKPRTFYTIENAFSTAEQVDLAIISLYSQTRWMLTTWNQSMVLKGNGTDILDVPLLRLSDSFANYSTINAQHNAFYEIFQQWYELIAKANTVLWSAELDEIIWPSQSAKEYAIAQGKFFRAFAYRNLGELYGGVPIVDAIVTSARYDFERATRIETYQFAIDDLEGALDGLPENATQPGRIVKAAAQHNLSQLYLSMGIEMENNGENPNAAYDKSIEYASEVIDGGKYELMTDRFGTRANEPKDVWWDLFRVGNVDFEHGNKECIWAFQINHDAFIEEDWASHLPYPRNYGPVLRWVDGIDGTGPDVGGRGVAFVSPTHYVRDSIWEATVSDGDIRNSEHNIQRTFFYNDSVNFPELYGQVVPYDVLYKDDDFRSIIFPIFWKLSDDELLLVPDFPSTGSHIFRNEYAIRLPETILLRAEAYFRKGEFQEACDDINIIRDRAQCTYRIVPADINLDFILDERARELYVEETRWNTLLRMGGTVATDRIKKYTFWQATTLATLNFDYNLWPIPQAVIDRNRDVRLEQNPGWRDR